MRALTLLFIFQFFIITSSNAQQWRWGKSAGGTGEDRGKAITGGSHNELYTAGFYSGNSTFDTYTLNSFGNTDCYVARYDTAGKCTWIKGFGGTSGDMANGVGTDRLGNVYATGQYQSTCTFNPGITSTSNGGYDAFLVKYDANGNFLWRNTFGGSDFDAGAAIVTDSLGNSFVTGTFKDSVNIDGHILKTPSGASNIFVAKFNSDGLCLWAKSAGGVAYHDGRAICLDKNGNVFITGTINSNFEVIFDTIHLAPNANALDAFIAKYTPSGECLWAKRIGDVNNDEGYTIAVDIANQIYIGGYFAIKTQIGATVLTGYGNEDVFLAKFDQQGNALWAKKAGSTGTDWPLGLRVDGQGNTYMSGWHNGTATFETVSLPSSGLFVTKYNTTGALIWAKSNTGLANALWHDDNGYTYITGCFSGKTTYDKELTAAGGLDVIIAKLNDIKTAEADFTISDSILCSTNCINFTDKSKFSPTTWKWSFPGGVPNSSNSATPGNVCYFSSGTYMISLTVTNSGGSTTKSKTITVRSKTFDWIKNQDAAFEEFAMTEEASIAVDKNGNQYVTGSFSYGIKFCDSSLWSGGNQVLFFLAKFDKNGNCVWVRQDNKSSKYIMAADIAVDNAGYVYVLGSYEENSSIGSFPLPDPYETKNAFLAKYDSLGKPVWAKYTGGIGHKFPYGLSVDKDQNAFITGYFSGVATFDNIGISDNGSDALFVAKYSSDGNCVWAKKGDGPNIQLGLDISCDQFGDPYVTGYFENSLTMDTITINSKNGDGFIAKYSAAGNIQWLKRLGGDLQDWGRNIAHDGNNNVYVSGEYQGLVDFDGVSLQATGIVIACFSSDGKCRWAKTSKGSSPRSTGLCTDKSGCINIGYFFSDTIYFENYFAKSKGGNDMYMVKYDNDGNCLWLRNGGGTANDYGMDIAASEAGDLYFVGSGKTGQYGEITINELTQTAFNDLITGKLFGMANAGYDATICTSGSVQLHASGGTAYAWSPSSGLSGTTSPTVTASPTVSTIYTVKVWDDKGCTTTDQVKVNITTPAVSLTLPFETVCSTDGPFLLKEGIPVGGTYGGIGVTGNYFDPQTVGFPYKGIITYTYFDSVSRCEGKTQDSVYVDLCTSIKKIANAIELKIVPNPVYDVSTVSIIGNELHETLIIDVYNGLGKLVFQKKTSEESFYFIKAGYATGIYNFIVRNRNNKIVTNQKLVIQ